MRHGKKERFEIILLKVFLQIARYSKVSPFWYFFEILEKHKGGPKEIQEFCSVQVPVSSIHFGCSMFRYSFMSCCSGSIPVLGPIPKQPFSARNLLEICTIYKLPQKDGFL